jgi:filamentous hemagglutinin family protein
MWKKIKTKLTTIWLHVVFFIIPAFIMSSSYANPVLNSVVAGSVTVQQSGNTVQVNQSSQRGIVAWDSFNISAGEKTKFNQPNASAVTLNRINPQQGVSRIFGQLIANGTIILINGAGLYFGSGAMVNVGSIIVSTANISNANFMAGKYIFDEPSTYVGAIVNKGTITAADLGVVALLGAVVENDGLIRAHLGSVVMGSGSEFTLDFNGDQLITFAVTAPATHGGVTNTGKIIANGGQILVTAAAAAGVLDNVINMSGYAEARSSSTGHDGSIILSASNGNVVVSGKLNVSAKRHSTASGGKVSITGNNILLTHSAAINANGSSLGAGGSVAIKAINNLQVASKITAQGGKVSGNGGSVETSGAKLNVSGAKINLTAAHGQTGTWLIDPSDLTISNNVTSNLTILNNTNTANQTNPAVPNLNVADLEAALSTANVLVKTSLSGTGGSGDITVMNNILWSSNNTLTLSAYRNINVNNNVTITNSGGATLVLRSDNTGSGLGTVNFNGNANVNISGGGAVNIYYNPVAYTAPTDFNPYVTGVTPNAFMLVNSATDLGHMATNLNGDYALGSNISLSGYIIPIGTAATPYTAKFDGQGYTISGLNIVDATANADLGLFGVTSGATIANVHLANASITENAAAHSIGALVGNVINSIIINDTITGSIAVAANNNSNAMYVGSLVGFLQTGSSLTSSYSSGTVNVALTANDSGSLSVGGLVGALANSAINNTYSTSAIQVSGLNNAGVINVGGLVGANGFVLVNNSGGSVSHSFSTGQVKSTVVATNNATTQVAGFVGAEASSASLTSDVWDTVASGLNKNHGVGNIVGVVTGLTAGCYSGHCGVDGGVATLSASNTYAILGWNLTGMWNIDSGQSYPYLVSSPDIMSASSAPRNGLLNFVTDVEVQSTPAALTQTNGVVTLDGVPTNLADFNASNFSNEITMDAQSVSSADQEKTKEQLNLITSYTNYVSNVPPTRPPEVAVYETSNVVVKEVSGDCTSSNQNVSVDNENNITLSESCTP